MSNVCYKVGREKILNWLNHGSGDLFLGVQLRFKGKRSGDHQLLDRIEWSRVFLKEGSNPQFHEVKMGNAFLPQEIFLKFSNSNTVSDLQIGEELDGQKAYQWLQYFPEDKEVDFAFFDERQLRLIAAFYGTIIFSGASINYGSVTQDDGAPPSADALFAMKMEGVDRKDDFEYVKPAFESATSFPPTPLEVLESVPFSSVYIGPTCPPKWYIVENESAD